MLSRVFLGTNDLERAERFYAPSWPRRNGRLASARSSVGGCGVRSGASRSLARAILSTGASRFCKNSRPEIATFAAVWRSAKED